MFSPISSFIFFLFDVVNPELVKKKKERQKKKREENSSNHLLKCFKRTKLRISGCVIYHRATQSLIRIPAGGVAVL